MNPILNPKLNAILKPNIKTQFEAIFGSEIFLDQHFSDLDSFVPNIFGPNFFEQRQQPQLQMKWVFT